MATYIGEMQKLVIGDKEYSLPSSGGSGTVTSVGLTNATNGGLTISGSPITSSGSITVGHSNVLTSAQTTQAVYPIKIDKNGHISAYGSAVTIPDISGKVDAAHTDTSSTYGTISSSIGYGEALLGTDSGGYGPRLEATSANSEFTSYLQLGQGWTELVSKSTSIGQEGEAGVSVGPTGPLLYANDSYILMNSSMISLNASAVLVPTPTSSYHAATKGYVDSVVVDEKMKWTASTSTNTYYPLQSTSTATTSTANTLNSISFYQYYNTAGGYRRLQMGNTTAYTSSGGAYGTIRLYGTGATYYGDLNPGTIGANSLTANRTWTLPNATGTIALTSDIPSNIITGSGTSGKIPKFTGTNTIGDGYGVTDNSSSTAVTSSDTNLITARTLYYAGYTKNSGTVTSVGISNATNGGLSVSGSPVTGSGTITVGLASAYGDTKNPYGSKTANYVLAAPNGSAGAPSFRALVAADIPDLSGTYVPVTQSGDANTRLEPTTTITIDPKNNGDVIQCTSTETTNFSSMSFGPYGAFIQAGTPSEMGMNIRGGIGVGVSYHVVDLNGNDDNNGYDNIYCQGGEVGLQSFNTDYTSGTQTIITPSAFNIIHATDSSNSSLFNIDTASGVANVPLYAQEHYDTTTSTVSLGKYFASGGITSSGGTTFFSFPTGRVFPSNYEIKSFSCTFLGRVANANGTGYYFIKSSSGGTGAVTFNYKSSFSMYNANNVSKTVTAAMQTVELEGGTNIAVNLAGGTDDFFSGTSTIRGYINNQPCIFTLQNIQFTVGPAS